MDLLLDTHAVLWFLAGDSKLSSPARSFIEDISNNKFVSIVSLWEIAIKLSLNKLTLSQPIGDIFPDQLRRNGFGLLSISIAHTSAVSSLVFHHRDPFDRLLIAQALTENMHIVSADSHFDQYAIKRVW